MNWPEGVDVGTVGPLLIAAATAWLGHKARKYIWKTRVEDEDHLVARSSSVELGSQLIGLAKAINDAVGVRDEIEKKLKETRHEMYNKLQVGLGELENAVRDIDKRVRQTEIEIGTIKGQFQNQPRRR